MAAPRASWLIAATHYRWVVVALYASCLVLALLALIFADRRAREEAYAIARERGSTLVALVELTRDWNASHGGVYVPVTPVTQPNPHLEHPRRDVTTIDGHPLTMINPAFMTRQIAEMARGLNGTRLHLTSLQPIRPDNRADAWESETLQMFERADVTDRLSLIEGQAAEPVFRYMAPLRVKAACLNCHAKQGYKLGDTRGGISVAMPATLLMALSERRQFREALALVFGLVALALLAHLVTARTRRQLLDMAGIHRSQEVVIDERTRGLRAATVELEARQRELRVAAAVFDTTADGIIVTDSSYGIVRVNPAFTALTGLGADALAGKHALQLLAPAGTPQQSAIETTLAATRHWEGEVTLQRRAGSTAIAWVSITTVADGDHVGHLVITLVDISLRKQAENRAWHLAYHDSLTGLPNRKLLGDRLQQMHAGARRHSRTYALLYLDLDRFKAVNDSLGHAAGDALLQECARRLLLCVRDEDTVARLGGDEFAIILAETANAENACMAAQRIIDALSRPFDLAGKPATVGASIGIAVFPQHGADLATMALQADGALYAAKAAGRNRYCVARVAEPASA